MAIVKSTRVIGIKDLSRKLQGMAKEVGGAARAEMLLDGAEVIADRVRRNIERRDLIEMGYLIDSVKAFKVNQWTAGVSVGEDSPASEYAATHEYGLEKQVITERQRAYFRWRCTQEPGSVFCALMNKATYTIPARPYFRPAVMSAKMPALQEVANALLMILGKYAL